jgi:hypothetical protein
MNNLSVQKAIAAGRTLEKLGYTYHDGELWKPPLGANPSPLLTRIAQLQAEVEALRKDSARLDWIIDNASSAGGGNGFTLKVFIPVDCECVRTAIDAAITKDISCYVSKDGDTAIRMLRTEAQELQRKTKDTHDWFEPLCYLPVWPHVKINFNPKASSPYRYCTKATIDKLLKEPK